MSKVFPNLTRGKGLQDEYLKKAAKCVNWLQYTIEITALELFSTVTSWNMITFYKSSSRIIYYYKDLKMY